MQCPTCKKGLVKENLKKTEIDRCPSCSGIWLEKGELNKLVDKKKQMVEFNTVENDSTIHGDKYPARDCPVCGKTMKKVDLLKDSPIIFDYCPVCEGFWLDKNELDQTKALLKKYKDQGKVFDNLFLSYIDIMLEAQGEYYF